MKQDSVHNLLLSDDDMLFCGMAIGYQDQDAIINQLASERRPLKNGLHFYDNLIYDNL